MSSNETFSFSISLGSPGSPPRPELFAVPPLSEFPLPGHLVLARNPANGRSMKLPTEVMNALTFCDTFRTLDEHVAELMAGSDGSPGRRRAIRDVLQSVLDGGLALRAGALCEELEPPSAPETPAADPVVAVITCDRPVALARLLDSMAASCDFERIHRCYVVDDSRSEASSRRNRELAERLAQRSTCPVSYFGRPQARALQAHLAARLPHCEDALRFLLDGDHWSEVLSTGVARNYCQLLSVGRPLVVFDDDTVCQVYASALEREGCEFSEGRLQARFFEDLSEMESFRLPEGADPIRRHLQCLGMSVPGALRALGVGRLDQAAFRHARPGHAARLRRHSRVLVTESGSVGDPGSADYAWLGMLPQETLEALCTDQRQATLAAAESRCWLGACRPTLAHSANFSQVTGFDNRDFLPPYFPIERGQDRIFGDTTRFLYPDSVSLVYPWAVLHLREHREIHRPARMRDLNPGGYPGLLTLDPLSRGDACPAAGLDARLAFLATSFGGLAAASLDSVVSLCSDGQLRQQTGALSRIADSLGRCRDAPQAWKDWLESALGRTRESVDKPLALLARTGGAEKAEIVAFWQGAWARFGEALTAWPEIRRAAGEWSATH